MGEQEIVRRHAVRASSGASGNNAVQPCEGGLHAAGLRDLVEERMGITKRDQVQCRAALEFAAKNAGVHPERRPGNLDVNRGRCLAVAETKPAIPTTPSLPMVPTSALAPSAVVITSEASPSMGK